MINKLKPAWLNENFDLVNKINELIDAINDLYFRLDRVEERQYNKSGKVWPPEPWPEPPS